MADEFVRRSEFDTWQRNLEKRLRSITAGGGAVTAFNGRTGAIVPTAGDYTAAQVGAISASLATAANDVLVASGPAAWVKKTLAELKTLLGLGTAAYTASTDYAVAAKGVTNGDSHNHSGGDGAAITEAALSLADNTTADVSTVRHGLVPKAPNDTAKFLRGDATWGTPSGSSGGILQLDIFTTPGANTWTKAAGATSVEIIMIGGGAGGGSGCRGATGTVRNGGGGGGGGGYTREILDASLLGATETVTVAAQVNGGPAKTSDGSGSAGTAGQDTTFGSWMKAKGGGAGPAGTNSTSDATGGSAGEGSINTGRAGANSKASGAAGVAAGQVTGNGASGGGSGGGITTGDTVSNGGAGGTGPACYGSALTGGTAGTSGGSGGNGNAVNNSIAFGGAGGGGGASSKTAAAGAGGDGGKYGAGGGGGGAAQGYNSGAGGKGAQGIAIVIQY